MKRFLLSAVMLGVTGLFTGCGEETKTTDTTKTTTPTGSVEVKKTEEVKKTGDEKTGGAAPAPAPK